MVIENPVPNFWKFLPGGVLLWGATFGIVLASLLVLSFLFSLVNHGFQRGSSIFFARVRDTAIDLFGLSARRVWAMSNLAFTEAIRRRVWAVLALYVVILLFAGWFLRPDVLDPARLYIDFVMFVSGLLTLALAVVLSAFSLPTDIANRTIYTIVTKPVRSTEILLGRILGFGAICTLLLAAMGAGGLVFVWRSLVHTHTIVAADLKPGKMRDAHGADVNILSGETSMTYKHIHKVDINAATGTGKTQAGESPGTADPNQTEQSIQGHYHEVTAEKVGDNVVYHVSEPRGYLMARVPVHAETLKFRDIEGQPTDAGISVGAMWEYRSYIEGATRAAAIWHFKGLRKEDFPQNEFPDGLLFDMTLAVFRTHKGDIEKTVAASMILSNPHTKIRSEPLNFATQEFAVHTETVPYLVRARRSPDGPVDDIDLWTGLIDNGELIVEIVCLDSQQYLGMARPDLYIRSSDRSFVWNYTKGFASIWLQMLVVTSFGVFFSTFLNGFVSLIATIATGAGGFITSFMFEVATGVAPGGGAAESFWRMWTKAPISTPMESGAASTAIKTFDFLLSNPALFLVSVMLPDMWSMNLGEWVASGYDIPMNDLAVHAVRAFGFCFSLVVLGHYIFKGRELAK